MSNGHVHPIFAPLLDFMAGGAEKPDALHVMPAEAEHISDPLCACKPIPEIQSNCSVLWVHRQSAT